MSMIRRVLSVYTVMGEPEMGVWCDVCQLPSKIVWPVSLLTANGVSQAHAEKCLNGCERKDDA